MSKTSIKPFRARLGLGLRLVTAAILGQTLFFKFSGAEESVYIFTKIGQEPWGRLGSAVCESVACVLLFIPGFRAGGAALSVGLMSGAIFFHLTSLGLEVKGDGGLLFALACTAWLSGAGSLWLHRKERPGKPVNL